MKVRPFQIGRGWERSQVIDAVVLWEDSGKRHVHGS